MMNNKMQRAASLTPKPIGDIISSPISRFLFFFFFCEPKAPQDTRVSPEPQQTKEITLLPLPPLFSVITTPPDSQRDHEGHCTASAFYHWIHRLQWTLCSSSHSESDSHFHFEVSRLKHIDEDVNSRGIRWDLTDITINVFYTPTGWKHTGKPSN